jgi:catechol 2,3-dioxygenase-like lactoylglutathione lyase family enzyme
MILNFLLKTPPIFCSTGHDATRQLLEPTTDHHRLPTEQERAPEGADCGPSVQTCIIPPIRRRLARRQPSLCRGELMASTLAQNVFQIGFVVPDIHKGMAFFKDKLGVPEFLFIDKPELQDETYLGKPAPLPIQLAFGWCGDTQVELIQPITGVSTYSKFLDHNPQGGMHHYGIEVPDYGKGVREMEASGFALVQGGRHNETRFAYFDTSGTIGALTEIVYLQPEERAFMHGLKHKK